FYAPYVPTRTIYYETSWAANDPLVHYTVPDLSNPANAVVPDVRSSPPPLALLGQAGPHYQPWGGGPWQFASANSATLLDLAVKDPLITGSDAWDFPIAEPLSPTWLGRIHRGTPWQTIYLKSQ